VILRNGYQQMVSVSRPSARRMKPTPQYPETVQIYPVAPVWGPLGAIESGIGQPNNPGLILSVFRGVELNNVSKVVVDQLGLSPVTMGVLVSAVAADVPAAVAGLRPNDIIVDLNSHPVFSVAELLKAIGPGLDPIALTINRRGAIFTLIVPAP